LYISSAFEVDGNAYEPVRMYACRTYIQANGNNIDMSKPLKKQRIYNLRAKLSENDLPTCRFFYFDSLHVQSARHWKGNVHYGGSEHEPSP
jgi:hypothetical protein